jgi:hypothetical protein
LLGTQFKKPKHAAKERGPVLTIHQSCDRGEGEDKDCQNGHIISSSWVLHLPVGCSCTEQGLCNAHELNIIILRMEKMNKAKFLFSREYKNKE